MPEVWGTLQIDSYWCCLAEPERTVLTALSTLVVAVPPFISSEDYTLLWLATGANSALKRADAVASIFYLEPGVFITPAGDEIEGFYLVGDFWPVLFAWIVGGHAPCAAPCSLLTFPL